MITNAKKSSGKEQKKALLQKAVRSAGKLPKKMPTDMDGLLKRGGFKQPNKKSEFLNSQMMERMRRRMPKDRVQGKRAFA